MIESHLELIGAASEAPSPAESETASEVSNLISSATNLAHALAWLPGQTDTRPFVVRCEALSRAFRPLFAALRTPPVENVSEDLVSLHENLLLLQSELQDACGTFCGPHKLPQARTPEGELVPRVAAIAADYLAAVSYRFTPESLAEYMQAYQDVAVLDKAELWKLIPALKLILLDQIAQRGRRLLQDPARSYGVTYMVFSLRQIRQTTWKLVIEPLIRFDRVLREDPADAYSRLD